MYSDIIHCVYMYNCMYVYIYIYIYIYICVCVYYICMLCIYVWIYAEISPIFEIFASCCVILMHLGMHFLIG
jgi:hypothetical protein